MKHPSKMTKISLEEFRSKVPIVSEKCSLYFNSSFQPPMSMIVANSIEKYISEALYEYNPKPTWIAQCEIVRAKIAKFINAKPEDIAFTRDTTEGCNLFQRSIPFQKGDNVVILESEHPNQSFGWLGLASKCLEIRVVPINESKLTSYNADTFKPYIDSNTKAIGLSSVMFHSGLRNDVKDICSVFRPLGIHILVDATQDVGFSKIDVQDLGVSAMAFGTHKGLSCPTGLGVLYVSPETLASLLPVPPILCGGSISNLSSSLKFNTDFECFSTCKRFEHLNKAVIQCLALGDYLDFLNSIQIDKAQTYLENLGLLLRSKLKQIGIETLGPNEVKLRSAQSNIVPITNPKWIDFLLENNVYVSQYRCGIRLSLGLYNNESDIDKVVDIVSKGLKCGISLE